MNNMEISKEEGELSDDDDVTVVEVSNLPKGVSTKTDFVTRKFQHRKRNSDEHRRDRRGYFDRENAKIDDDRRRRRRKRGLGGYGITDSLTMAREKLKKNQLPKEVPQLMSLVTPRPVKSTSLFLPLSSIPLPPSRSPLSNCAAPQPPPTSELRPQNFLYQNLRMKKPFRETGLKKSPRLLYTNSPLSSDLDEVNYVDMLLEYKEIQKKLEVINQEEGRLAEEKKKNKENYEVNKSNSDLAEVPDKNASISKGETSIKPVDKDDDLEVLELRRMCLESLTITTEKIPAEGGKNSLQYSHRGRTRLTSCRRNRSPVINRRTSNDQGSSVRSRKSRLSPLRSKEHFTPARNIAKRSWEEILEDSEKMAEKIFGDTRAKRPAVNPELEFKKFVQLRGQPPSLSDSTKKRYQLMVSENEIRDRQPEINKNGSTLSGDNYEQVEMDLDSDNEDNLAADPVKEFIPAIEDWKKQEDIPGLDGIFADSIQKDSAASKQFLMKTGHHGYPGILVDNNPPVFYPHLDHDSSIYHDPSINASFPSSKSQCFYRTENKSVPIEPQFALPGHRVVHSPYMMNSGMPKASLTSAVSSEELGPLDMAKCQNSMLLAHNPLVPLAARDIMVENRHRSSDALGVVAMSLNSMLKTNEEKPDVENGLVENCKTEYTHLMWNEKAEQMNEMSDEGEDDEELLRQMLLSDLAKRQNQTKKSEIQAVTTQETRKPITEKPLLLEEQRSATSIVESSNISTQKPSQPAVVRHLLAQTGISSTSKSPVIHFDASCLPQGLLKGSGTSLLPSTVSSAGADLNCLSVQKTVHRSSQLSSLAESVVLQKPAKASTTSSSLQPQLSSLSRTVSTVSSLMGDSGLPSASISHAKSAEAVPLPKFSLPSLKVTFKTQPKKAPNARVPMPQHKPVVITLSGDTDSDSEGSDAESVPELSLSLLGNLDSLLKEARQASECVQSTSNITEIKAEKCIMIKPDEINKEEKSEKIMRISPLPDTADWKSNTLTEKVSPKKDSAVTSDDLKRDPVSIEAEGTSLTSTKPNQSIGMGLDMWLADGRKVELKLLVKKLGQLKKDFLSERSLLQTDERLLASSELEMTRKKGQYRQAVIRLEKLKEQMSATEKIVGHNHQHIITLSKKTQELRGSTAKRKSRLEVLRKEMAEAGRRLGLASAPQKEGPLDHSTVVTDDAKVKGNILTGKSSGQGILAASGSVSNHTVNSTSSGNSIAAEKKHLQELAKKYEEMIEIYKRKQASKSVNQKALLTETSHSVSRKKKVFRVEHVKTEEVMALGKLNEVPKEATADIVPRRRRSLIDQSPTTTKPDFMDDSVSLQQTKDMSHDGKQNGKEKDLKCDEAIFNKIQSITERRLRQVHKALTEHLQIMGTDDKTSSIDERMFQMDPFLKFQPSVEKVFGFNDICKVSSKKTTAISTAFKPYHSSLLCFRSYRFSPYYRMKEGRMIHTSSFKISHNIPLCHFDLMGKCNDDKCLWQHEADYKCSHRETLIDIASYYPALAGISETTPLEAYAEMIGQFVDDYMKQNCKLTPSEQALLLLSNTYKAIGITASHCVLPEPRRWKLSAPEKPAGALPDDAKKISTCSKMKDSLAINEDDIILEQDVRYWMLVTQEAEDIETAVADDPNNDQLWLKLAYKKMSDTRRVKPEETHSVGLHILSRALEENQGSEILWRHYLNLFGKRGDASQLMNFYRQALNYAPSYYLFWKYLELSNTYSNKMDVCKSIRQFLCSPRCKEDATKRSHCLLEIILYQAGLSVEIGRAKTGREIIESVIKSRVSVIWLNMVWIDRIILWMSYIHLVEFNRLPESLYDPADGFPGRIVNKVLFSVPWSKDGKVTPDRLLNIVDEAIQSCTCCIIESADSQDWFCQLHLTKLCLMLECRGYEATVVSCREILENFPMFEDIWIFLVDLTNSYSDDHSTAHKVIAEALEHNPKFIRLRLASISLRLAQGNYDQALETAEWCSLILFNVEIHTSSSADPNLLFCKLLNQMLPCTFQAPSLVQDVTEAWLSRHQASIWLAYCVLLDLQGAHDQATEAYWTAISTIKDSADLGRFCLYFLRRCYGSLRRQMPWYGSSDVQSVHSWLDFDALTFQVLRILPSKFSLPHDPDQMWTNYANHNRVIDFYMECLADDVSIIKAYEKFVHLMPMNTVLIRRACNFLVKRNHMAVSNGICTAALYEMPKSLPLWKIKLLIAFLDGNIDQTRKVFQMATDNLPCSLNLWKNFVLFELLQKNTSGVQWIEQRCRELQISIGSTLKAVLPSRD